jgi:hypothetical protein
MTLRFQNSAPIAAKADPQTSHLAGKEYTESGRRNSDKRKVLAWMLQNQRWMTSMEISKESGFERYMVGRRLSDLYRDGHISKGAAMSCQVTGHLAITWKAKGSNEQVESKHAA